MLRIEDRWVWDSWMADDGDRYHLFYLQAPTSLGDAELRHENATIGHASSADLVEWRVEDDALGPTAAAWDDLALWTGSVARADDGTWLMYYTAIHTGGHGVKDQRLGLATSDDLTVWTKVGERPVAIADPRWYLTLEEDPTASETWRDPFVFRDGAGWHMLITARVPGTRNENGVIAHATSDDGLAWTVREPLGPPAGFGQIEVAQVRRIGDAWVLVFTCHPDEQSEAQKARFGLFSTWSMVVPSPLGPFDLEAARPFEAEPDLFAAPLVQQRNGSWALVGFRNLFSQGLVELEIVDPVPVRLEDGRLVAA